MGIVDKAKNLAQRKSGQGKEVVGKHTDNPSLETEGVKDQGAADLKDAGEKVKDAGRKTKDALSD